MFVKDPDQRLGSNGLEEIKKHSFFKNIDWNAIYNKKIKPPFIPKINSDVDTKYIDSVNLLKFFNIFIFKEFTNCTPTDSYTAGESLDNSENPYQSKIKSK